MEHKQCSIMPIARFVVPMTACCRVTPLYACWRSRLIPSVRMQAWDTAVGQALDPVLTGSTFNATVTNFTVVQSRDLSTAGMVEGYGFSINGRVFKQESRNICCMLQHCQSLWRSLQCRLMNKAMLVRRLLSRQLLRHFIPDWHGIP